MSVVRDGSRPSWWGAVLGGVVCAGLVIGGVSPSWAGEGAGAGVGAPVTGAFSLGGAVQGVVDERSGGFSFRVSAGGLDLAWDSRAAGVGAGRFGFGEGWAVAGLGFVDTVGGVRVVPSRGVQGVFEADESVSSGLAGYAGSDLKFSQTPGVLPARVDGVLGEREYAFVLRELGGLTSYFDEEGNPVAKIDAHENRVDWEWLAEHRLSRVVSEVGVFTELDWSDPGRVQVTARSGADGPARPAGVVELEHDRVAGVVDAVGARTTVRYTAEGLVHQISAVSGAVTDLLWQSLPDGTVAVDRVSVSDSVSGEQIIERRWEAVVGLASGWPAVAQPGSQGGPGHRTALTDGVSRVVSAYDGALMTGQDIVVSTASGERTVQAQAFMFPDGAGEAPGRGDRPTGMSLTYTNPAGASRVLAEEFVFDDLGRVTRRVRADETVMTTVFDDQLPDVPGVPVDRLVPVGLPVLQRTEAPDGSVTEERYTLNQARTAVVVAETFTGGTGIELSRVGRKEFVVEPDGFVSTERVFPQGGEGAPVVTEHTRQVDLTSGTVTTTDTIAAGTELAGTTSTVTDLLHGQPTDVTDVLGRTATVAYDEAGRPVAATDPAGNTTRTEYRSRQGDGVNATVTTGPDRVVVTTEHDGLDRPTRTVDNILDGVATEGHERVVERFAYPAPGVVEHTDAWGWQTTTRQDVLGRTTTATVSGGLSQVTEYDDAAGTQSVGVTRTGNLADAELFTTQHVDLTGQVSKTTGVRADGIPVAESVAEYDGFGRPARSRDGAADVSVEYDRHGNPVTTTITPAGGTAPGDPLTATRRFDERGTSIEKTLTAGAESRAAGEWEFDLLGREKTVTDQAGGVTSYEYTADGLVERVETTAGAVTVNTFDELTRRLIETVITSPVGDPVARGYEYDEVTGRVLAVFDPVDPAGTAIRYESDAWGNTTKVIYPDGTTIEHEYDTHGRKSRTKDVAGAVTALEYDAAGLLMAATQRTPGQSNPTASVRYTYDDLGRVTGLERGNGVRTEVAFTSASEIATETTTGPDGAVQAERAYVYDPIGNLTTRIDTVSDPATGESSTSTTAYEYDQHRRLVSSSVHEGDSVDGAVTTATEYTLNVSGDVTREQVTTTAPEGEGSETTIREFEYGPTGQLTRIATTTPDGHTETAIQDYDEAGNLTHAADGTRYTYNATNRPVEETTPEGVVLSTQYWATGDRATLTTGEHTTKYHWDGGALLNDTHTTGAGTRTASYLLGTSREARTLVGRGASDEGARVSRPESTYAIHDRHGNTTELTDTTGRMTAGYDYTDYGTTTLHTHADEPAADEASRYPFLYAGEYTNPTGTQHLAVRTYAPDRLSFTSLDTVAQQNRYGFGNANPITNVDPSGNFSITDAFNGFVIGVSVLFTGVAIAATAGAWAAAGAAWTLPVIMAAASTTFGAVATVATTGISAARFIGEHHPEVLTLDPGTDRTLFHAELALILPSMMGAGGAVIGRDIAKGGNRGFEPLSLRSATGKLNSSPPATLVDQSLTTTSVSPVTVAQTLDVPPPIVSTIAQVQPGNEIGTWLSMRMSALQAIPENAAFNVSVSGRPLDPTRNWFDLASRAFGKLNKYYVNSSSGGEVGDFLNRHGPLVTGAEGYLDNLRYAVQQVGKATETQLQEFNALLPHYNDIPNVQSLFPQLSPVVNVRRTLVLPV